MAIQFKLYNRKYQLHFYNEVWVLQTKHQLDEILSLFSPQEMAKVKIMPLDNNIEVQLHAIFLEGRTAQEIKQKFSLLVDMKDKYQKMDPKGEMKKKGKGRFGKKDKSVENHKNKVSEVGKENKAESENKKGD